MNSELYYFNNHLRNGLSFCKKVYGLFDKIRKSPGGIQRLRLRSDRVVKVLIEELIPIARYIQARYNQGRHLKVRWIDGAQQYDADLLCSGVLTDIGMVPKRQWIEVTTAVNENDHLLRRLFDEQGYEFGVKGISFDSKNKKIISKPYVSNKIEVQEDLANKILERINSKNKILYPKETVLVVQCILDTIFLEDEWNSAITQVQKSCVSHRFQEIFIFDSNHHYSATIYK